MLILNPKSTSNHQCQTQTLLDIKSEFYGKPLNIRSSGHICASCCTTTGLVEPICGIHSWAHESRPCTIYLPHSTAEQGPRGLLQLWLTWHWKQNNEWKTRGTLLFKAHACQPILHAITFPPFISIHDDSCWEMDHFRRKSWCFFVNHFFGG